MTTAGDIQVWRSLLERRPPAPRRIHRNIRTRVWEVSPFEKFPHPNPLPEGEGIGGCPCPEGGGIGWGSGPFLCGEDALDEPGGRAALPVGNGDDPAAVPFDDRLADDRVRLPVAALDEDVRPQAANERQRRIVVEHGDVVDGLHRCEQGHATVLVHDRPGRAFQAPDRCVAVDCDDQDVAARLGLRQRVDVADVQQVEAAVGEDDGLSLAPEAGQPLGQRVGREQLPGGIGGWHGSVGGGSFFGWGGERVRRPG